MKMKETFRFKCYPEKDELSDPHVVCPARWRGTSTSKIMVDGRRFAKIKEVAYVTKITLKDS